MLNRIELIGNIGRTPDLRQTDGGTPVCNLTIATDRHWKNNAGEKREETTWHDVVVFDTLAENCAAHLRKGSLVRVEGRLRNRKYEKDGQTRYKTEIVALSVLFLDKKEGVQF